MFVEKVAAFGTSTAIKHEKALVQLKAVLLTECLVGDVVGVKPQLRKENVSCMEALAHGDGEASVQ